MKGGKTAPKKRHMVLGSRAALDRMEALLKRKGCTFHCADWDGDWFIVYSEPDPACT